MRTFILAFVVQISTFGSINSQFQYYNQQQFNPYNIYGGLGFNQPIQQQTYQPNNQQAYRPNNQQANRPNNQQNFNSPNQPYRTQKKPKPTVANRNPQNTQTGSNTALRLSERKCSEYLKKSQNSVFVASLSLITNIQGIQTDNCEASQGLIVGGENAKAGEFPHMAG